MPCSYPIVRTADFRTLNYILASIAKDVCYLMSQGGGSGVTSVSGTSDRISVTGTTTPVVDIAATYVGQTSLTTLGTVSTGTWNGTAITGQYGGTGVNNSGKTITLGGNLVTSGAFATTLTSTNVTNVTLPTTGTLSTLAGTETLTNKTITAPAISAPVISSGATFTGNITSSGNIIINGVSSTFRTTNAGSNITTANLVADLDGSLSTAGAQAILMESTSGLIFTVANGTRRIARAALKVTNAVNTAGSESGDLSLYTQSAGTAIAEKLRVTSAGAIAVTGTITAIGTTGNQTINKPSGTVNIAAAGTTVTVTNSLVTTSSLVFAVIRTNDSTAVIKNVVPGSGSFVITLNAAATATTSVGFFVVNAF